jgi:hypothetical protein
MRSLAKERAEGESLQGPFAKKNSLEAGASKLLI